MADNKKYYYLRLKDNFFDSDEILVLESMPDGILFSNILLKLYLRSLKNNGKLMLNDRIPYNSIMLSQITRQPVAIVEKAINAFEALGLVEVLDNGAIYMLDIQSFIGESSTEADRKRNYRTRIEAEKNQLLGTNVPPNVGQMSDKNPPEIEIEIELEKEKDIDKEIEALGQEITIVHDVIQEYNRICKSLPEVRAVTDKRKKAVRARWKENGKSFDFFIGYFHRIEASNFLTGRSGKDWKANFDWVMNPSNMAKVLEGNYDNRDQRLPSGDSSKNDILGSVNAILAEMGKDNEQRSRDCQNSSDDVWGLWARQ